MNPDRRHRWLWAWVVIGLVVVIAAASGVTYALVRHPSAPSSAGGSGARHGSSTTSTPGGAQASTPTTAHPVARLAVASSAPRSGAHAVRSNSTIQVRLSTSVSLGTLRPTLSPAVAGTWRQTSPTVLTFTPKGPLTPYTSETVTIPGGRRGLRATDGSRLSSSVRIHFTVAAGSTLRLQELLAELHYLPLRFTPRGGTRAVQDTALPQRGAFAWRWAHSSSHLTGQWARGTDNVITKGAVMSFEQQAGLSVDGIAGPSVWKALLADKAANHMDRSPYTSVLVSKTLPEHLTLWDNGRVRFANVPVNTGLAGAQTTNGTYPVFEHVVASDMKGTNPNGSTYNDPHVPWASYFNHGEALHGFPRASYGFPQSNGCVEMPISDAGKLWPSTPIGTLVTVIGPNAT